MTKNNTEVPQAPLLHLSSANIDRDGVYLLDAFDYMYFYVGSAVSDKFCEDVLEVPNFMSIPEGMVGLFMYTSHLKKNHPCVGFHDLTHIFLK